MFRVPNEIKEIAEFLLATIILNSHRSFYGTQDRSRYMIGHRWCHRVAYLPELLIDSTFELPARREPLKEGAVLDRHPEMTVLWREQTSLHSITLHSIGPYLHA